MKYKRVRAAGLLAVTLAAAMFIESTQTACATSQAAFDVDIEEEIFLEEEIAEEAPEDTFEAESEEIGSEETYAEEEQEEQVIEIIDETEDAVESENASWNELTEEFILSEDEIEVKEDLASNDVLSDLLEMEEGVDYAENEVIALADNAAEAEKIARAYGGELIDFAYGLATISLEDSEFTVVEAFEYGIDPDNNVPAVEANLYLSFDEEDAELCDWVNQVEYLGHTDPYLNPGSGLYQWQHEALGSFDAWDVTLGKSDIVVAIIDSGVQTDHEDLKAAIVDNYEQVNAETLAMGLNGNNDDGYGHGTHVAGIVAASIGNKVGGAGIAPGAKILPINVCKPTNPSSPVVSYMVKAIQYVAGAVDSSESTYYTTRRADIINMSIGSNTYNEAMKTAINAAYAQGVTVVAAMGNDGANLVKYPARYNHVIGVCATRKDNTLADFSDYGSWADISAPGKGIVSCIMSDSGNSYGAKDGTSMASPVVAGACALYMSYVGHVSPDTMEKVLKSTATKISQEDAGAGVVNVAAMLGKAPSSDKPSSANYPVKTISLNETALTLSSPAVGLLEDADLSIETLINSEGDNLLSLKKDKYVSFKWSSSNTNVVRIDGDEQGLGLTSVSIVPVSAGTATITCQVLDGNGKKANCKVKVVGNKAISDIALKCDTISEYVVENSKGKLKSVTLFKDAVDSGDEIILDEELKCSELVFYAVQSTKEGDKDADINPPLFKNSNPKVVSIEPEDSSGKRIRVKALSKGTAKITATATDGSGKSTTVTVTVKQLATDMSVSGQEYVQAGSKATFKANIIPSNANNKKVMWEVGEYEGRDRALKAISGVTINGSGVVSVAQTSNYPYKICVRATSLENSSISGTAYFSITPRATSVQIYNLDASSSSDWTTLAPVDIGKYKSTLTLVGYAVVPGNKGGGKVAFTSSNENVVSITNTDFDSTTGKTTVELKALKRGKATITCKAIDGSKKSSKVTLKVVIPASGISLTTKNNQSNSIAYGSTVKIEGTVGKAYGTPDNSKIEWDYDIVAYKKSGRSDNLKTENPSLLNAIKAEKAFFEFSNGKVKVNSKEKFENFIRKYGYDSKGEELYVDFGLLVSATTADGSGSYAQSSTIRAIAPTTYIDLYKYKVEDDGSGKKIYTLSEEKSYTVEIDLADKKYNPTIFDIRNDSGLSGALKNIFTLNSSNTNVASGYLGTHSSSGKTGLIIYPYKTGECKFTIMPRDGSGFKTVLKVKVVDTSKNK